MKKVLFLIILFIVVFFQINSCRKDFLEIYPGSILDQSKLADEKGIETLLIGAYSMLDGVSANTGGWESASSNWLYGSVRGIEGNKGSDAGDSNYDIIAIQNFAETPSNIWSTNYLILFYSILF
jgi:hypothetical protein